MSFAVFTIVAVVSVLVLLILVLTSGSPLAALKVRASATPRAGGVERLSGGL
jgi:hypothetical protein